MSIHPLTSRIACAGILFLVAGCATQPAAPAVRFLPPSAHLRVLELPATVEDGSLRRLLHADEKQVPAETLQADRRRLEQLLDAALSQSLAHAELPSLAAASVTSLDAAEGMSIGQAIDPTTLSALQTQHPADAFLRIQLTDYGETPRSWRTAYISFEVVSTVTIGTLLYTKTATRPLAVAYVAEEGIEEFGEGYSGFWLLNRLSRPVRIQVDWVDGTTGKVLWHDTETGLADWQWKDLWHMDDVARDLLLTTSTDKAVTALVDELEGR